MNEASSLRRGITWLALAEVAVRVTSITTAIGVARLVGPVALGNYLVALSLLSYGSVLGDAGLTLYAQRQLLLGGEKTPFRTDIITAVLIVQVLASAFAIAGILFATQSLPISAEARRVVWVGAPLLLAQALSLLYVLQALERMKELALLRVLAQAVGSLGGLAAVAIAKDVAWLIAFTWIGMLAADIVCWAVLRRRGISLGTFDRALLRRTLASGAPFLLNALAITILLNADILIIGVVSGSREAGVYGAAYRIALGVLTLASVIVISVYPRFVRLSNSDGGAFEELLERLVTLSLRITLPLTVAVTVYAEAIIRAVYGSKYGAAASVLRIVFLWVPFGWLSTFASQALVAAGHQRRQIVIACTSAGLLLGLLCLLVPSYGAAGAAWAVAVTEAVTALNFLRSVRLAVGARLRRVVASAWPYLVVPAIPLVIARVTGAVAAMPLGVLVAVGGIALLERHQEASTWSLIRG